MKTIQEQIEVMQHFANGGAIESKSNDSITSAMNGQWHLTSSPIWDWRTTDYRIKEQEYPIWVKHKKYELIVKHNGVKNYTLIKGTGDMLELVDHMNMDEWKQIEEPKTVTIEKWLIKCGEIGHYILEADSTYLEYSFKGSCIKKLDSYEVEL